jgi:putative ABC transport system ATP-binding protein
MNLGKPIRMGGPLAIEAGRLVKTYPGAKQPVLGGVSLDIFEGECVMLVGPSGSGKTTLLSILGCVLRPDSGTLRLFGRDITGLTEADLPRIRRGLIGFVFQGHNLISSLTAEENVLFQLNMRGVGGPAAIDRSRTLLSDVGLGLWRDVLPENLSGGQRQRVAVARALAGAPRLVLADEPTASLDLDTGRQVMSLFKGLARERGVTLVIVTHDARIFDYADRIEHLEDGRIVRNEDASIPSIRISTAKFWPGT